MWSLRDIIKKMAAQWGIPSIWRHFLLICDEKFWEIIAINLRWDPSFATSHFAIEQPSQKYLRLVANRPHWRKFAILLNNPPLKHTILLATSCREWPASNIKMILPLSISDICEWPVHCGIVDSHWCQLCHGPLSPRRLLSLFSGLFFVCDCSSIP